MRFSRRSACLFLGSVVWLVPELVTAQPSSLAHLLPDNTVASLEVAPAAQWLDHPLRKKIQSSEVFQQIWRSPDVMKARGGLTLVELALGDSVENIARQLTSGGFIIAVDRETEGLIVIARSEDEQWLTTYLARLVKLARDDAANKKQPDPIKQAEYRGLVGYRYQNGIVTTVDNYLLASNKGETLKAVIDRYLDADTAAEQSGKPQPAATPEASAGQRIAWGTIDLDTLRAGGVAPELLGGRAENFAAELILGGLLTTLHQSSTVTGSLTLGEQAATLTLAAPHQAAAIPEERQFFFGPNNDGRALPLLKLDTAVASLSTYRDVSQLWLRAGDLFDANVNDQLAQADNTLTTLFSGRDFGEDILGALQPELRIVVARQDFSNQAVVPAIKLPGFALVTKLREPDVMRPELKRIFQSFIGFLNITGAQNRQPQLDLGMESVGDLQIYSATYVPEIDRREEAAVPIQFNFSPSLAFVDDVAILSSTTDLARRVAEQMAGSATATETPQSANTLVEIDLAALREILEDNSQQLISQNMLSDGHTREEAEAEIGTLLSILKLLKQASLTLEFQQTAALSATLRLAD